MFEDVVKMFPEFNDDPEELERQQEIIDQLNGWYKNPAKFLEEAYGVKLRLWQRLLLRIRSIPRCRGMVRKYQMPDILGTDGDE